MKKIRIFLPLLLLLCASTHALAQEDADNDFDFSTYEYSMQQIGTVWDHLNFYSLSREYPPDIKECFISFVLAYPNSGLQVILAQVLGYDQGYSVGDFVMDKSSGYMQADIMTELVHGIQMCLWRMKDGSTMVAVALRGEEYADIEDVQDEVGDSDDMEDLNVISINNLMFYHIRKDEAIWRPCTPKKLCGRTFDFSEYDIQLPQEGKDILLYHTTDARKNVVLKWNDGKFKVN